jgi:hypothetical protein
LVADPISDQVVDDTAALVEQKSVLALADLQLVDVVCQHCVQPFARARSIDNQLAHVRNVEHADVVSHGLMFLHDAGVLHGHEPARERHHLRAAPNVFVVKGRLFLRNFSHSNILAVNHASVKMMPRTTDTTGYNGLKLILLGLCVLRVLCASS